MPVVIGDPQFVSPSVQAAPHLTARLSWSPLSATLSWRRIQVILGRSGQVIPGAEPFTLIGGEPFVLVGGEPLETAPYTPIY